jgi:hypothetical protein
MIHSVKFTCVKLVMHRRNPDLDEYQVLDALRKNQLRATADYLHALL